MEQKKIIAFQKKLLDAKRVGLDSMIFLYHFADYLQYVDLTQALFELVEQRKIEVITSMITVSEIFVHIEQKADRATLIAYEHAITSLPALSIHAIDWQIARLAAKLRAKYPSLRLPDALQLATALLSECNIFLTNDRKIRCREIEVMYMDELLR